MAAFSGLHVACHAGALVSAIHVQRPIVGKTIWSESLASASTTTRAAPQQGGQLVMRVYSTANAWVSIGPSPDATNGPRDYITALTPYDFEVYPGDKLAWILDA